jgi:16S rRNA (cytosine1402-N4)-methyltransferase
VLQRETISLLAPERGGLFVDGTVGLGGHSEALLNASPATRVIGIDLDSESLELVRERLAPFGERFRAVQANFREIANVLEQAGEQDAGGILVDLGVSSLQLDSPQRGFSFRFEAPLDMRLDARGSGPTAADLLRELSEEEIARILFEYGEERRSRRIARRIVERRSEGKLLESTSDLAEVVARAVGYSKAQKIHPATRTFQALRIAVNQELDGLDRFIGTAIDLLQPDGRFAAISFHSLEDRIVKQEYRRLSGFCQCPPRLPVCSCGARQTVGDIDTPSGSPDQPNSLRIRALAAPNCARAASSVQARQVAPSVTLVPVKIANRSRY